MTDYCEPSDLHEFGLPRGTVPNPARLVGSVSASGDYFALDGHEYYTGDELRFRPDGGGSLPSPIAVLTTYYAIRLDDARFQVSASVGGSAIDLTTAGAGVLVISRLPIASAIRYASALVDDCLPNAVLPLTAPISPVIRMTTAEIAAAKLGYFAGSSPKSLTDILDAARKRLDRWATGRPVRGENKPKAAGLAVAAAAGLNDARGWDRYGGTL